MLQNIAMQALYDRKAEEVGGSVDFAADLANAIAAVDLTDVMQDDNPFKSVEKQVSIFHAVCPYNKTTLRHLPVEVFDNLHDAAC